MIRPFTILCFCAFAGAGAWLYQVKHQVTTQDRELRDIWRQVEVIRDRTTILRAEWALLNEPDRLRRVATRHLPLEAMQPAQFTRMPEMERRLPLAVAFAGPPNLFAPPESPRNAAPPVMLAAPAVPPAPAPAPAAIAPARPVMLAAAVPAPPPRPATVAPASPAARTNPPQDLRVPEAPAPQALAAALAAQRAAVTRVPPPLPPRPAPLREVAPRPIAAPPPVLPPAPTPPTLFAQAPSPPRSLLPTTLVAPANAAPAAPAPRMARAPDPVAPYFSALGSGSGGRPLLAAPVPVSAAALDAPRASLFR